MIIFLNPFCKDAKRAMEDLPADSRPGTEHLPHFSMVHI